MLLLLAAVVVVSTLLVRLRDRHRAELLKGATAARRAGDSGTRAEALSALKEAGRIRLGQDLRNEAIACLAWTDLDLLPGAGIDLAGKRSEDAVLAPDLGYLAATTQESTLELLGIDGRALQAPFAPEDGSVPTPLGFDSEGRRVAVATGSTGHRTLQVWDWKSDSILTLGPFLEGASGLAHEGSHLVVCRAPSTLEILNWEGETVETFSLSEPPAHTAWSPTSGRLAVSFAPGSPGGAGRLEVFTRSGQPDHRSTTPGAISSLAWNPAGRLLAVGLENGSLHAFDAASGTDAFRTEGHYDAVDRVAWSHDGTLLASGCRASRVRLWDGRQGVPLSKHQARAGRLAFSRDTRWLGPVSWNGQLKRLKVIRSDVSFRGSGHPRVPGGITGAAWSLRPAGVLGTVAADGVRLWNREAGEIAHLTDVDHPLGIAFLPDRMLVCNAGGVHSWDLTLDGSRLEIGPVSRFAAIQGCQAMAVALKPPRIAVGTTEGVCLLDPVRGSVTRLEGTGDFASIAISRDGEWLAASSHRAAAEALVWKLGRNPASDPGPTGKSNAASPPQRLPVDGPANLAFSTRNGALDSLAIGDTKSYRFWSLDGDHWIKHPKKATIENEMADLPGRLVFSPRETALVISYKRSYLQVRNPLDLSVMTQPNFDEQWPLAISPGGMLMANEGLGGTLFIWDLAAIRRELYALGLDWEELKDRPFPPENIPQIESAARTTR